MFKQKFELLDRDARRHGLFAAAQHNVGIMRDTGVPMTDDEFYRIAYEAGAGYQGRQANETD